MIVNVSNLDLSAIKDKRLKAILICLFTDSFVAKDELPVHMTTSRGWWGDYFDITINGQKKEYSLGSRLWLFGRTKITDETVSEVEGYIKDALKILIDSVVIKKLEVIVTRIPDGITFSIKTDRENITFEGLKL